MTFAGHVCESIICLLYPNRQKRKRYLLKREKRKRHSKETGNNDTGFNGRRIFYPPRENHEAGKKEEGKKKAVKSDREIENGKSGKGNSSYTATNTHARYQLKNKRILHAYCAFDVTQPWFINCAVVK